MISTFPNTRRSLFAREDLSFHLLLSLVLFGIFFSYCFLITYGTGTFFGTEFLGSAFDAIGHHLVHGEVGIEPEYARWESFKLDDGRLVMYFGPFPGFLRLIPNRLFPEHWGEWSRLSMFLASILSTLAALEIMLLALSRNNALPNAQKKSLALLSIGGFGFGTPLLFLMSCGFIYHEANIWGLTCALWGTFFTLRLVLAEGNRELNLGALSCAAAATLLSRVTFGVSQYLVLTILGITLLLEPRGPLLGSHIRIRIVDRLRGSNLFRPAILSKLFIILLPAILALMFQLWYNQARFGSIVKFADYTRYTAKLDPQNNSISEIGGMMSLKRIPFGLYSYFRIRPNYFMLRPPYVRLQEVDDFTPGTYPVGFTGGPKMNVISLLLVSPWLIAGAAAGAWLLARKAPRLWSSITAALLLQVVFVASYYWITTRYASEFLPLLVFLYAVFLLHTSGTAFRRAKNGLSYQCLVLLLLVGISSVATVSSTLEYVTHYRRGIPEEFKRELKHFFRNANPVGD